MALAGVILSSCAGSVARNIMDENKAKAQTRSNLAQEDRTSISKNGNQTKICETAFTDEFAKTDITELFQSLSSHESEKDEYETWEAYQVRIENRMSKFDKQFYVSIGLNSEHIVYDADSQRLNFNPKAFGEVRLAEFIDQAINRKYKANTGSEKYSIRESRGEKLGIIVQRQDVDAFSFTGSNAFGAVTDVTAYKQESYGLFQEIKSDAALWEHVLDSNVNRSYGAAIVSIALPPDEAKRLRTTMSAIVVIKPHSPFTFIDTDFKKATFNSPSANSDKQKYVIGDIMCLAITSDAEIIHVQATQ